MRSAYIPNWLRLIDASRQAAADPAQSAAHLDAMTFDARQRWAIPSDKRADQHIFTAFTAAARAYAFQDTISARARLADIVTALADVLAAIIDRNTPPESPPLRRYRADVDG